MKTHFTQWYFNNPLFHGNQDFCSYGDTEDEARRSLAGEEGWTLTRTEQVPYTYAPQANALAAALTGRWVATPISKEHKECGWHLQRTDGHALPDRAAVKLWMAPPGYHGKGMFEFSASPPRDSKGSFVQAYAPDEKGYSVQVRCGSIKCSEKKSAEQIARDIERRLLPDAIKLCKATADIIARYEDAENAQQHTLEKMCAACGMPVPPKRPAGHGNHWQVNVYKGSKYVFDFNVSSADCVKVSIDLTPDKAAKLAEYLMNL